MSATNYLGLNIPDKNSKGRVVTEVFEPNFTKLDQAAEVVDRDKNSIWGGLDGGGLIEDPSVTKVVGKRYIGADGKAYICLKPSNINNSTNYAPCNVVDNLDKLQNLEKFNSMTIDIEPSFKGFSSHNARVYKKGNVVTLYVHDAKPINANISVNTPVLQLPQEFRPAYGLENGTITISGGGGIRAYLSTNGILLFQGAGSGYVPDHPHSISFTYFTNH